MVDPDEASKALSSTTTATTTTNARLVVDDLLGPVQQTMLVPLIGRSIETLKGRDVGLIHDQKAVDIVDSIDYAEYDRWAQSPSVSGSVVRTLIVDEQVRSFLNHHPNGIVVEFGVGLNSRYERLHDSEDDRYGQATWIEMDLPDVMEIRKRFFEETSNRFMIASDMHNVEYWMSFLQDHSGGVNDSDIGSVGEESTHHKQPHPSSASALSARPWCFVSEAVLIYSEADRVKHLFEEILLAAEADNQDVWFVFDTVSRSMVSSQQHHPIMRHMARESWFRWGCDDPVGIVGREWTDGVLVLHQQHTFADLRPSVARKLPFPQNLLTLYLPFVIRWATPGHYMNVFVRRTLSENVDEPLDRKVLEL